MILSPVALTPLIEHSPLLDKVETALRGAGHKTAADLLLKLQQDAGVQMDPETARLYKAYEPVTTTRLNNVLMSSYVLLDAGSLKDSFKKTLDTLLIKQPAQKKQATLRM